MTLAEALLAIALFTVSIETPSQIQKGWTARGHEGSAVGWAEFVPTNPPANCIIHVPPLTGSTMWIWLHEIEHCRTGLWHSN